MMYNVGKTIINHPPVITNFTGGMFTIPSGGKNGIVLPTLIRILNDTPLWEYDGILMTNYWSYPLVN